MPSRFNLSNFSSCRAAVLLVVCTMKRMKKAVLNKAEGRTAHKFQFELKLTSVGALERVLKGLDGSALFVQATRCGSTRRVWQ